MLILLAFTPFSPRLQAEEIKAATIAPKVSAVKNIGVEEFERLRNSDKAIVLDVRTPAEYDKGHLPGAVNIDCTARDFSEKVAALDKRQTYLVHCAGGVRSAKACARMEKLNFTNVYNLEGGLTAWQKTGRPIEKTKVEQR